MSLPSENPFGEVLTDDWLTETENQTRFWDQSDELRHIAYVAAERSVSAWGLLLPMQIHQMSRIEPQVVLVSRNGHPGQGLADAKAASIFAALLAETGGGKSDVIGLASAMIPPAHVISDGTGQGIAKTFAETKTVVKDDAGKELPVPRQVTRYFTHSAVMHAPEVDDLAAEFAREGSKTSGTLRKAWTGEINGSTTGDVNRRVILRPQTYRFGGIWGVQPAKSAPILADFDGGTPQRWTWAPVEEFRDGLVRNPPQAVPTFAPPTWAAPVTPAAAVGGPIFGTPGSAMPDEIEADTPLPDPIWVQWSPQMQADIPPLQAAQREARKALREARNRGLPTAELAAKTRRTMMDSHMILTRIKLAAGQAFLHGRTNPTDQDWWAAGIQIEVSRRCLAEAWRESQRAANEALVDKGTQRGVEMHAANASRTAQENAEIENHALTIWNRCSSKPRLKSDFRNAWNSRYRPPRPAISAATELLISEGIADSRGRLSIAKSATGHFFATVRGMAIEPEGYTFTAAPDVA